MCRRARVHPAMAKPWRDLDSAESWLQSIRNGAHRPQDRCFSPFSPSPLPGRLHAMGLDLHAAPPRLAGGALYNKVNDDRILAGAGGLAFFGLLALFPGVAAFVALYGLFADWSTINGHLATFTFMLPG